MGEADIIFEIIPTRGNIIVYLNAGLHERLHGPITSVDSEAMAIMMDAMACRRSIRETVANIEIFGGSVDPEVKIRLGLLRLLPDTSF